MERRSWPWKRKSSDKSSAEKAAAILDSSGAAIAQAKTQVDKDNYKKPNYVQISVESYSHLTGLEDQVKRYEEQIQTLEEQIKELDENLSTANSEITTKENLVKQHMKVAEEAVSGWEKAEAEALALKSHLESVTLEKLTAEDRASHLDGALKECMRQIRNLKEEHEKNLQEVVLSKTKQWEKIKHEFEAKIVSMDQELLHSAADNAAISRSLQERSNMLIKISEEKSKAEADIELLKSNIESCEKEINSLKYELHVVSKELEIRNEEKNMSVRSADAANKQHLEGVKKIAKLEAECQRLRGLVRKKLPGPAALAQMKMEVESLGRDYGDSRLKRSPVRPPSPYLSPMPEFSLENVQRFHKENDFLTERLLATEEETKMLKEALAKRNSELQVSRNMCAKTASKLQILEAQLQINNQGRSSLKSIIQIPADASFSHNASNPPSLTSMSEDGNEDERSCAESWATALISELSQFKKGENTEKPVKADNASDLELMDDFLEMEKLANNSDRSISVSDGPVIKGPDTPCNSAPRETTRGKDSDSSATGACSDVEALSASPESGMKMTLMKLQSRISAIFDTRSNEDDVDKIFKDIKQVLQDAHDTLHQHSMSCISDEKQCSDALSNRKTCPDDLDWMGDAKPANGADQTSNKEMAASIVQIHEFVLLLGKEAMTVHDISVDGDALDRKIEEFSATFHKVLNNNASLFDFVLDLSLVLDKARALKFNILGYKGVESDVSSPDCIDKVALPENKVIQRDASRERYENGCRNIIGLTPNPDVSDDNGGSDYEIRTSLKISLEDYEKLRSEKDKMATDLASSTGNLEITKTQLQELEQLLAEMKTQLAGSQNSYGLAETQLKCMAESYRSLEARAQELEAEIKILQAKIESQDDELQEEKRGHQDALARCKDLEERLLRNESCSSQEDADKSKQEKELAAAAEKLAECQETIFLLGKQLKALHPNSELTSSHQNERTQKEDETTVGAMNSQDMDPVEMDDVSMTSLQRTGDESPQHPHNFPCSPSESEASYLRSPVNSKRPKHRPTLSTSSSSSSGPTPEKQQRGFSRFFSSKGKNSQ
ncbi:uncharacterized protein J3R85_007686 [Psidium guajava]|nr:uncharacterized protein J3R85_007686 [Psidium guajava]